MGTHANNELFLVYVAPFGASLFGLIAAFRALEPRSSRESTRLQRRSAVALGFLLRLLRSVADGTRSPAG